MFTVLRANDEAEDNKSAWPKKDNELQKNEISEKEKKKKNQWYTVQVQFIPVP